MTQKELINRIEEYESDGQLLEAFVLQSAYIESLIKLFIDVKFKLDIRDANIWVLETLKDDLKDATLYKLTEFIFQCKWLPEDKKSLMSNYRIKRNEVMHDLLREIRKSDFNNEIKSVYDNGKSIIAIPELSTINGFNKILEKQESFSGRDTKHITQISEDKISDRENEIMRLRLQGKTYQEIADKLKITRERVRQILNLTLSKVSRRYVDNHALVTNKYSSREYKQSKNIRDAQGIIREICKSYNVSENDLLSKSRKAKLVFPRHLAIYLIRENLKLSFPETAKILKRDDHTTAMHAYQKMKKLIQEQKISITTTK